MADKVRIPVVNYRSPTKISMHLDTAMSLCLLMHVCVRVSVT